tara:strand:- start:116 stop:262 length:147 start_codon:yes stop_codon:yes gene_type:complete
VVLVVMVYKIQFQVPLFIMEAVEVVVDSQAQVEQVVQVAVEQVVKPVL